MKSSEEEELVYWCFCLSFIGAELSFPSSSFECLPAHTPEY